MSLWWEGYVWICYGTSGIITIICINFVITHRTRGNSRYVYRVRETSLLFIVYKRTLLALGWLMVSGWGSSFSFMQIYVSTLWILNNVYISTLVTLCTQLLTTLLSNVFPSNNVISKLVNSLQPQTVLIVNS